jgi:hypothetical protein
LLVDALLFDLLFTLLKFKKDSDINFQSIPRVYNLIPVNLSAGFAAKASFLVLSVQIQVPVVLGSDHRIEV